VPDLRTFCEAPEAEEATIALSAEESRHLVAANRARPGDPVVAFDGTGREWLCRLGEADRRRAVLAVEAERTCRRPEVAVALAQAIPKGKGMDAIVRRATELGAARIYPLYTERIEVRLDPRRAREKAAKWRDAAIEAAKQSGNPFLPRIDSPQTLERFLEAEVVAFDTRLIASLEAGAAAPGRLLADGTRRVAWLVGPEGDFAPSETERALSCGFRPVSLAPLTLRCETAAVAALAILQREIGMGKG